MDRSELGRVLDEDRAEWRLLTEELDSAPDVADGPDGWNSRDVYAHLARWMAHSTADIESLFAGGGTVGLNGSDDEINERWHAEDTRLSFEQARERAQQAFDRRLRVLESPSRDDLLSVDLEGAIRLDGAEHYRAHRRH